MEKPEASRQTGRTDGRLAFTLYVPIPTILHIFIFPLAGIGTFLEPTARRRPGSASRPNRPWWWLAVPQVSSNRSLPDPVPSFISNVVILENVARHRRESAPRVESQGHRLRRVRSDRVLAVPEGVREHTFRRFAPRESM